MRSFAFSHEITGISLVALTCVKISQSVSCFLFFRLIALPSPGLNFLKSCIAIEAASVVDGNAESLKQLRKLFNLGVELYGHHDDGLWLEFCAQERKVILADKTIYPLDLRTSPCCIIQGYCSTIY